MSALTLVMKELDMNEDDFYHVRAYHSRDKNLQQTKNSGDSSSPTNSESSGFSSLGNSNSISPASCEDSSTLTASPLTVRPSNRSEPTRAELPESPKSVITVKQAPIGKEVSKLVQSEKSNRKDQIIYQSRNILDLGSNMQPYPWQLTSPMFGPKIAERRWVHFYSDIDTPTGGTKLCKDCGFIDPLFS